MNHLHKILENTPGHTRPGNQIDVHSFLSARNQEVQALLTEIESPKKNGKMIFQRLPKKMRRRVMSTSVKRMPKDLQISHKLSIDKQQIKKHIRRRKDFRCRPRNRRLDYIRRQKNGQWLETHIWFAKRFHIVLKDGFKLPKNSHDKTYRACYRAIGNHCLAQDISYMSCIELKGPYEEIIEGLMHHTNQDCGLTFKAKCYNQGTREGSIFMFKRDSYPYGAIGRVSFIWDTCTQEKIRALWIWTEPAIYKQLADELQMTFNLQQNDSNFLEWEPPILKKPKVVDKTIKIRNNSIAATQINYFINGNMKMTLLKGNLNRFRLTGPLANSVLNRVLYPANSKNYNKENWWSSHINNFKSSINVQKKLWKSLNGADRPESFPPNCVIGFHTIDPRIVFPEKRTKAIPSSKECLLSDDYTFKLPIEASFSKIWDINIREWSTKNKMLNCKINMFRSNCVITGNDKIAFGENLMSVIPILLIQRPGQCQPVARPGYGSGWDIILPAGWAMPFWLGLIMNGCQPGGLRETTTMVLERCLPRLDEPDTDAGKNRSTLEKEEAMQKHFKLPPQMRNNYIKLGFQTPFHCSWDVLCNEWMLNPSRIFVLRNIKIITFLHNLTLKLKEKIDVDNLKTEFSDYQNCLVPVRLEISQKGVLKPNSHIYLPTTNDLNNIGTQSYLGPLEKIHKDLNVFKRKIYRLEHKKTLKIFKT